MRKNGDSRRKIKALGKGPVVFWGLVGAVMVTPGVETRGQGLRPMNGAFERVWFVGFLLMWGLSQGIGMLNHEDHEGARR